jgi:hypothetical protein
VPFFRSSVEIVRESNVLHLKTVRLQFDGVVAEMPAKMVAGSQNSLQAWGAGVSVWVKFTHENEKYPLHGKAYRASVASLARQNVNEYYVYFRFTNLSLTEKRQLRQMVKEVLLLSL